ncbi:MAG: AcrB/AcrD/AcrF family protein [Terriglobia bacterium]|nr:AcrB/AcrD/AcrF family protein [Terriglobia bacterium]
MYQPEAYTMALLFMIISMICWGSWANTQKLTTGFPFQLFYWDYVIGVILASLVWGFTLGSVHGGVTAFLPNLLQASSPKIALALAGGIVFNVANLLLVAAIAVAGMAVAFPIGIGLALIVGVVLNYLIQPRGNPLLLFGGVALVLIAILIDAVAYKRREGNNVVSARGVRLSVVSGILMGLFYPFVASSTIGESALGPYSVSLVFAVGVAVCAIPVNAWLMRHPLTGEHPVSMAKYRAAPSHFHFWGILGGAIWCTGAVSNFVASNTHIVGPAISYAIGQGATMVSAAWGVFIWREFANAPTNSRRLVPLMFVFFVVGLGVIATAPLFG